MLPRSTDFMKLLLTIILATSLAALQFAAADSTVTADQIVADAEKTADVQLKYLNGKTNTDWTWAVMYAGYSELTGVSKKGADYRAALQTMANGCKWTPLVNSKAPFNADNLCIGQSLLSLCAGPGGDGQAIRPLVETADRLVAELNATADDPMHLTWSWCDALFMAPPVLARLSAMTHASKYIDAMDKEWWKVARILYDNNERLFYRDSRFLKTTSEHGKKVFWARGNGWVAMGLARVLEFMPKDYPSRGRYEALFKEMMEKIASLQGADGAWRTSLLDPEKFPTSEGSGTVFFAYATAWGIGHGLLDRAVYLPVAAKAWSALLAMRRPDGIPGFVQPVADRPGFCTPAGTQLYATGGFLLAALELSKLAPFPLPATAKLTETLAPPTPSPVGTTGAQSVPQPPPNARAFARYVPERMDDIAWESDRIAHRLYGPALEKHEKTGSGIDVWVKSTHAMIVNEFYRRGDYHVDHGVGLDCYSVGQSRGCGGLGIWDGGKLWVSRVWQDYKILQSGPDCAAFLLVYAPWDANGREVSENRIVSLNGGSNLDRLESTVSSPVSGDLVVAVGLGKHKEPGILFQDKDRGILSYWEPADGGAAKNGMIGCAVLFDPAQFAGFAAAPYDNLVLLRATAGKSFAYYAGACWSKSGDFNSNEDWLKYLREFRPVFGKKSAVPTAP